MFGRDGFENDSSQIVWEEITITSMLNRGLSVVNTQYCRLLLISCESSYLQVHLTQKAAFRQQILLHTK